LGQAQQYDGTESNISFCHITTRMGLVESWATLSSVIKGLSWSRSYGSWIYNYLCKQCISPLTLRVRINHSGEVYLIQHYVIKFVSGLRQVGGFSAGTLVSSTNKTDRHDITEKLLKVELTVITWSRPVSFLHGGDPYYMGKGCNNVCRITWGVIWNFQNH